MPVPDEYRKIRTLPGGTCAEMSLVRHRQWNYYRALRVSNPIDVTQKKIEESDIYQQYYREYMIMQHLGNNCHPHIVNAYKLGTFSSKSLYSETEYAYVYIETNYVEGDTLLQYLEDNKNFISSEEVVHLALQISDALAYCHDEYSNSDVKKYKVIHNDIKPDNIMRRKDGEYVLIDFSAAHTLVDGEVFPADEIDNRSEVAKNYVAPEVLGKIRNQRGGEEMSVILNEQTDIYSFGVVLFQCLTGQLPSHSGEKQVGPRDDIMEGRRASFEEYYKEKNNWPYAGNYQCDYPQWLEEVILNCLKKDPKERYANGKELHEDIKAKIKDYEELQREKEMIRCFPGTDRSEGEILQEVDESSDKQSDPKQNTANDTRRDSNDEVERLTKKLQQEKSKRAKLIVGFVIGIIVAAIIAGGVIRHYKKNIDTGEDIVYEIETLRKSVDSLNIQISQKDEQILQLKDSVSEKNAQIQDIIRIYSTK